jgi:hypothetical protein
VLESRSLSLFVRGTSEVLVGVLVVIVIVIAVAVIVIGGGV